ncbi:hypothetical protein [Streptomyces sp. NPDC058268]|uniref:hypothetical protein n=1 Tax=Streptomyces sp. NPDC058268 TaxID=3346413 RepID=UPI0036E6E72F
MVLAHEGAVALFAGQAGHAAGARTNQWKSRGLLDSGQDKEELVIIRSVKH